MGYYTRYGLSIIEGDSNLIDIFRNESDSAKHALDDNGDSNNECKWYDSDKELLSFSLKHPKSLFLLQGVGEEAGDEWKLYVQDGHSQLCKGKMVFPDFDKSKLLSDIRESKINKVLDK